MCNFLPHLTMFLVILEICSLTLCVPVKMGDNGSISWACYSTQHIDLSLYNGARIHSSLL